MNTFSNVIIRICIFVSLLGLSALCVRYSVSDFYYEAAKKQYNTINVDEERSAEILLPVYQDLERSLSLRHNNPEALSLKANSLYAHWWISPDAQFYENSLLLQEADSLHRDSLKYRKLWSFGFSQLALIHVQKATLDSDFDQWFEAAYEIGRFETSIARSLMQVGMINWTRLTEKQRTLTLDYIRISIEQKANSPGYMRNVLRSYGQLEYVCGLLANTQRKTKVCS